MQMYIYASNFCQLLLTEKPPLISQTFECVYDYIDTYWQSNTGNTHIINTQTHSLVQIQSTRTVVNGKTF